MASFLKLARNKYFVVLAFFLVWMLFFDPRDWALISARKSKLNELRESEKRITAEIEKTRAELNSLKTSAATIEKYAREKYLMKKDNEDLYLIKSQ
jgi:cell division protein FtsB